LATYSVSKEKVDDMLEELTKSKILKKKFNTVFLVDDFTASGTSYFRKKNDKWGGKIFKFINSVFNKDVRADSPVYDLIQEDELLDIHIIFYVATEQAINKLHENITAFQQEFTNYSFQFRIHAIQILPTEIKNRVTADQPFMALIKKYFDAEIIDSHYQMGKHDEPQLGFNECSLPLVLHHNTPNNSLPILWFPEDKKILGLFPRVTRHKDEQA